MEPRGPTEETPITKKDIEDREGDEEIK